MFDDIDMGIFFVVLFADKNNVNAPKYILNYNGEKLSHILVVWFDIY